MNFTHSIGFLQSQRDADSPLNQWLNEHPIVLVLFLGVMGLLLILYGIKELKSGVSKDKYGNEITGWLGKFTASIKLFGGIGVIIFAAFKMMGVSPETSQVENSIKESTDLPIQSRSDYRTFTGKQGRTIIAKIVSVTEDSVLIRRDDGAELSTDIEIYSIADQQFIRTWKNDK